MDQRKLIVALTLGVAIGAHSLAMAAEPNEEFDMATPLPPGQTMVDDSLDGAAGRVDTLLGHFDPGFFNLLDSDDNSSKFGNGFASGLNGLSLTPDGSIFFAVTGTENVLFDPDIGSHTQIGSYQVYLDYYDSGGEFLETVIMGVESLQLDMDTIWQFGNLDRVGGSVDIHLDNLLGLGNGDPIDFFLFTGLPAGQPFTAEITTAQFEAGLGLFDAAGGNQLDFDIDTGPGMLPLISGFVPLTGQIVLAVTGASDPDFEGEHAEVGLYSLKVFAVPEPNAAALLALGGLLSLLLVWRRKK